MVAPPSLHNSGVRYEWVDAEQPIAELPPALLDRIEAVSPRKAHDTKASRYSGPPAPAWGDAALNSIVEEIEERLPGDRNEELFKAGCRVSRIANGGHIEWSEAEARLVDAARRDDFLDEETEAVLRNAREETEGQSAGPEPKPDFRLHTRGVQPDFRLHTRGAVRPA